MIQDAWASVFYSPLQLSQALRSLQVSHSTYAFVQSDQESRYRHRISDFGYEQPAWPIILTSVLDMGKLDKINRSPLIVFVCDSYATLSHTNITMMPNTGCIVDDVKQCLLNSKPGPFDFQFKIPKITDFVAIAAKPSFINKLQTATYKINPYALRVDLQKKFVLHIAGRISRKRVRDAAKQSLRSESIIMPLLEDPDCQKLIEVVKAVKNGADVYDVANRYNIESFDVNYILNSESKWLKELHSST